MEQNKLIFQIEQLRMQLCNLAKEKGISHHSVIELSQELDNYIVQYVRQYGGRNSKAGEQSLSRSSSLPD
ncbi:MULTISPECIES: aspartyl-phosphate phosphatase Spo0E family protein [Brevibacillus]|uniref:aspartyl-phosphate phosphatase Spo0E family protein n=1 Tax=Brevibacillus TaxID=55080 RepID=UPI001D0AC6A5|nr:aspartyl-phosphate phosphatase Spo0E family protein [Brevibacillus borstelensis]MCC0564620.1 aspartyl-phosphate phosphatase Spo0E family protein [Brevibacillus borstelensis]MED1744644.1 aspartyl-phosphate phosphatase Spo0E family protein [Brevibacillus borstelensis]MED1854244.1 aspartyl-phosphate phosphatase Spo0E family protein [Brevibacillus borstelensis]MED1873301.1 aspartyl-phosphate phosphatase Spo0E family protein [Brevibacillus borstelensis]